MRNQLSEIAELVARRRQLLRLTQSELADLTGVGIRTIQLIENAKANATWSTMIKIMDALGLEVDIQIKNKQDETDSGSAIQ